MKIMRKIVNIVLSFMLVILLFAGLTVGFVYLSFFDIDRMEESIADEGFYESYRDALKSRLTTQLRNSGTGEDFIESLVPNDIRLIFRNTLYSLYGDKSLEKDCSDYMLEYENDLKSKVKAEAIRQGLDESDIDEETIDEFVSNIMNASVYDVSTIPFSSEISPYVVLAKNIIKTVLIYCAVVCAVLLILLVIMNVIRKRDSVFKYLTVIFSGASIMSVASFLYLYIANPVSERFASYDLFAKIVGGYSNVFMTCLLTVSVIFLVLTAIFATVRYITYRRSL